MAPQKVFTLSQVAQHKSKTDCWIPKKFQAIGFFKKIIKINVGTHRYKNQNHHLFKKIIISVKEFKIKYFFKFK